MPGARLKSYENGKFHEHIVDSGTAAVYYDRERQQVTARFETSCAARRAIAHYNAVSAERVEWA